LIADEQTTRCFSSDDEKRMLNATIGLDAYLPGGARPGRR
jgi:hypothetical protein